MASRYPVLTPPVIIDQVAEPDFGRMRPAPMPRGNSRREIMAGDTAEEVQQRRGDARQDLAHPLADRAQHTTGGCSGANASALEANAAIARAPSVIASAAGRSPAG